MAPHLHAEEQEEEEEEEEEEGGGVGVGGYHAHSERIYTLVTAARTRKKHPNLRGTK